MFQIFQFNTRFRIVTTILCLQPLFVAPLENKKPRWFQKTGSPKNGGWNFHAQQTQPTRSRPHHRHRRQRQRPRVEKKAFHRSSWRRWRRGQRQGGWWGGSSTPGHERRILFWLLGFCHILPIFSKAFFGTVGIFGSPIFRSKTAQNRRDFFFDVVAVVVTFFKRNLLDFVSVSSYHAQVIFMWIN